VRVSKASLFEVTNTLINPFRASSHATRELHHILVRLESNDGVVGWGESATLEDPYYLGETTQTAWHILKDFLIPRVKGKDFANVAEFAALYSVVKGNTFAKAGIETAAWDLVGRVQGKSVAELLGGTRQEIESGVSLGIERDGARLDELIERYLAEGYRRIKLKVAPGADVETLARVRARFPAVPLMVDANAAYTLNDAEHLARFDAFGLTMIEQPLDFGDFHDHAALQGRLQTSICLDESVRTVRDAQLAIRLGSCRIMNVKVARVGGLLEAKRIHDVCLESGIPVWCGGMHDFGIGRAANIALSSLRGFSIPGDVSGFDKYFEEDIVDPPIVAREGIIRVPTGPGLGYEPNMERIERRTIRRFDA
jgi:O-succinylbenzoate synthase